jgi:hypothetical protein
MQIENDYDKEVYNGDIGYIDDVDPNVGEIVASFDGRSITYGFGELDMPVPAYAATIYKSQGSEYPAVVIPLLTQHYTMLQRNLLYTGVTSGKRLVVLIGQKKAVAIAVRNVSGRRRWSKLVEWLALRNVSTRSFGLYAGCPFGVQMTGWDHEFAVPFINEGHFRVTDPGPLRAPIRDFSLRRDESLDLILETKIAPDAKSTAPEFPSGTVRITTECASLENISGVKVKLMGVIPYRVRTSTNHRAGENEHTEEAKIHALDAEVRGNLEAHYTIDWLENFPMSPFVWPDFVKTKIETATTRKFGLGDDGITLFSTDSRESSSRAAAKIVVAGAELYVCALHRREKDDLVKPGCIVYVGTPDEEFRKKVRVAVSFALGVYLVDLGSAVYSEDWEIVSFKSRSSYSVDRKVLDLVVMPPAPLGPRWQHEVDRVPFMRLVNAVFQNYETLDFGNLSWAYWHALCATPHIASVHFGAAIELLLRQYAATKPDQFPRGIITDRPIWRRLSADVEEAISKLEIAEEKKSALRENVGGLNRVHQRDTMEAVLKDLGIALGADEAQAWKRRNDAAHGIAMEAGEELDVIRDIKLLKVIFHRMALRIINGADTYHDYATPGFPIRKLTDPVPPA